MGTVVLLIDNSNIFISGKEKYGDMNARFSYSEFEKICAGDDAIVEKHIAGSTPPSNDKFWTRMGKRGYKVHTYERVSAGYGHTREKGVDMILGMQGTRAIEKCKPDRVVLLTGDADFIPIANLRDEIRAENGDSFILDVWAFSDSLSPELKRVSDHVFKIDDFQERLIYFERQDGCCESFNEHYARIEEEKEAALRAEQKRMEEMAKKKAALEAEQRKIEEITPLGYTPLVAALEAEQKKIEEMAEKEAALEAEQKRMEEAKAAAEAEATEAGSMSLFEKVVLGVAGAVLLVGGVFLAAVLDSDPFD